MPPSNRYGIDISQKNIDSAKTRYPEINWYQGTINDNPFDDKFDLIILSDILEHVENDLELFKKASNLSKYLAVNIPMEKCYATRKRKYGPSDFAGHLRAYNFKDVLDLINKVNMKIISFKIKYVIKEPFWQKRYARDYFRKSDSNQALIRLRLFTYRLIIFKLSYKLFSSNFFGTLHSCRRMEIKIKK